ncbi:PilZ domain-containing protein [Salinibius halmophilus]|uniref:PilZ domain-containing protein n=1 Tax=Salinibius halmophilus TaxID=1853216 RepID=UPI000E6650EA|nr:PilZ domain-containing protein [Salinibius halmophilus]
MAINDFFKVKDQGFVQLAAFDTERPDLAEYFPEFRTALASAEVSAHLTKAHELIDTLKEGPTQEALDHLYQATWILKRALLGQALEQADVPSSVFVISEGGMQIKLNPGFKVGDSVAILIIHTPELRSSLIQGQVVKAGTDALEIEFVQLTPRTRQNLAARLLKIQAAQRKQD